MRRVRASGWATWCATAVIAIGVSWPAGARADEPTGSEALFRQGRAAAERGNYKEACEKFAESRRIERTIGATLNLADCREHLGDLVTAFDLYREASTMMDSSDARRAFTDQRASALDARIPRLTVKLAANASEQARVRRGDVVLDAASLGAPTRVNPGDQAVVVTAPGHKPALFTAHLLEGDTKELTVRVGDLEPAAGRQPADARTRPITTTNATQRTTGFIIGGLGVASLVAAGVSGVLFWEKKGDLDSECPNGLCRDDAMRVREVDAAKQLATINTITLVAGVVAVGVGAALILTSTRTTFAVDRVAVRLSPGWMGVDGRFW